MNGWYFVEGICIRSKEFGHSAANFPISINRLGEWDAQLGYEPAYKHTRSGVTWVQDYFEHRLRFGLTSLEKFVSPCHEWSW